MKEQPSGDLGDPWMTTLKQCQFIVSNFLYLPKNNNQMIKPYFYHLFQNMSTTYHVSLVVLGQLGFVKGEAG